MKRYAMLVALLMLVLPLRAQESARWDGADDLPTTPYACDGTPPQRTRAAYDGTAPSDPPSLSDVYNVLHVPRVIGQGYYAQVAQGIDEASRDLGNVILTTDAHTRVDVLRQARVIGNYIEATDGLIVSPVSQDLAPTLSEFIRMGSWVVSYDLDPGPSARAWHVEAAEPSALAYALAESLARQLSEGGRFAILTTGHDRWIAELQAYLEQCHPELVWLETVVIADDVAAAAEATAQLLATHGDALDVVLALDSRLLAGAGQAVVDAQRCPVTAQQAAARRADDVVLLAGIGYPNDVRALVTDGCVPEVVMWNPSDVGYVALEVLLAAVDGRLQPGAARFTSARLGRLEVIGSVVVLGVPAAFDAETIADLDF